MTRICYERSELRVVYAKYTAIMVLMSKIYTTFTSKKSDLQSTIRTYRRHTNYNLSSTNTRTLVITNTELNRLFSSRRITLNRNNKSYNLSDSTDGSSQSNQIFFVPFNNISSNISPKPMAANCGGIIGALLPWHTNWSN